MEGWSLDEYNELIKEHKSIMSKNRKAGEEIAVITNGLRTHYCPDTWEHSPMALVWNEDNKKYEVIYEDLEPEAVDFLQSHFEEIKLTRLDDVEAYIKKHATWNGQKLFKED